MPATARSEAEPWSSWRSGASSRSFARIISTPCGGASSGSPPCGTS